MNETGDIKKANGLTVKVRQWWPKEII